jgi:acyl-CoA-binding protein
LFAQCAARPGLCLSIRSPAAKAKSKHAGDGRKNRKGQMNFSGRLQFEFWKWYVS